MPTSMMFWAVATVERMGVHSIAVPHRWQLKRNMKYPCAWLLMSL